jgi:hypothetical protein
MATPVPQNDAAPFAALPGETNLDTTTPTDGFVTVAVTVTLVGSTTQVAADYATLAAVNLSSPSATIAWAQE